MASPASGPEALTCVVVDDEPHARSLVDEFLADYDQMNLTGQAGNGREAVDLIHETEPDLLFLDVQMPGMDGFEVLEQLDAVPYVVFSTAYDEYAIRAFEAGAVDYLLKPYSRDRFETAVERATERIRTERRSSSSATETDASEDAVEEATDRAAPTHVDQIAALLQDVRTERSDTDAPLERLYVRHGSKIVPVDVGSIRWAEAAGDYTKLHTDDDTHLASIGLGDLADRLPADRFQRVHRSHLVALPVVDHLRSDGSGGYVLHLDDGTSLRVSRSYAPKIRDFIV